MIGGIEVRERDVERYLVKRVKECGGEIRKVKWLGRRGAPDRRVMLAPFPVWVEVKRPGQRATRAQTREHNRMRTHSEKVTVVCSHIGVDRMIYDLLSGNAMIHLYV